MSFEEKSRSVSHLLQVEEAWAALEPTAPQLKVMLLAVAHGRVAGTYLQRRLGMLPSTLTRIVDKLDASGLLVREQDSIDRRMVYYLPTEKGRKAVLGLFPGAG